MPKSLSLFDYLSSGMLNKTYSAARIKIFHPVMRVVLRVREEDYELNDGLLKS